MEIKFSTENKIAVCAGSPDEAKNAALLFDGIVHICPTIGSAPRAVFPEGFNADRDLRNKFHEFCYNFVLANPRIAGNPGNAFRALPTNIVRDGSAVDILMSKDDKLIYSLIEESYINNEGGIRDEFLAVMKPLGVIDTPVIAEHKNLLNEHKTVGDIAVTVSGLRLIDVSNTDWEQIVEFRKDKQAVKDLRRLRTFLVDNFKDKPRDYIENKILTELDKYENMLKSQGFKTFTGAIGSVFDAKTVTAAGAAAVTAVFLGEPVLGLTGAATIEIGKFGVQVAKDLYALREMKRDHPLAYIVRANKELS